MNYLNNILQYFNITALPSSIIPLPSEAIEDCRISYYSAKVLGLNGRNVQVQNLDFETIFQNCQDDYERQIVSNCKSLINRHSTDLNQFKSLFLHNSREGLVQFTKPEFNSDKDASFCVKIDLGKDGPIVD